MVSIVVADRIDLMPPYRKRLEKLGELTVFEDKPRSVAELKARVAGAEVAVVSRCPLPAAFFAGLPRLRFVTLWRTGYDDVDVEAATRHGVAVANAPGYSSEAVAEHVFALLLAFLRRVPEADRRMREGRFDCTVLRGRELRGKVMGIVGTGRIGARVAEIAKCFGMEVIAHDLKRPGALADRLGFRYVALDELYGKSDVISLHLPLTAQTEGMVGRDAFGKMKPAAVLINTARGRLVDEPALVDALRARRISGACLDVFPEEPLPRDSPLLELDNVVVTPHTAFNTWEAIEDCTRIAVENIEAFLAGRAVNVVNPAALAGSLRPGAPAG